MATFYSAIFCVNYFWLVPATIIRNDNKSLYFIVNACLIIVICGIIPVWFETHGGLPLPKHKVQAEISVSQYLMGYIKFVIRDGITMVLAAGLAYALRLSEERENVRRRELMLNAEQRQIELKSLKAQLNPHFLFNSLNNIYALIGFAPERAQEALHELSGMLRFMIYDSASSFVPLSKEAQFITNYAQLMKLRLGSATNLECNINVDREEELYIAPLLFLSLVENAFKHSGSNDRDNFIVIDLSIAGANLVCRTSNTFPSEKNRTMPGMEKESGVGIENVRKQLRLLYPERHNFQISDTVGVFTAEIKIAVSALKTDAHSTKNKNNEQYNKMRDNR